MTPLDSSSLAASPPRGGIYFPLAAPFIFPRGGCGYTVPLGFIACFRRLLLSFFLDREFMPSLGCLSLLGQAYFSLVAFDEVTFTVL